MHETNKAHFRNLLPNRFLPSSVGRALEWSSRGHGLKPHGGRGGNFWWNLFCSLDLSDNLIEMYQISLSLITWMKSFYFSSQNRHTHECSTTYLQESQFATSYHAGHQGVSMGHHRGESEEFIVWKWERTQSMDSPWLWNPEQISIEIQKWGLNGR